MPEKTSSGIKFYNFVIPGQETVSEQISSILTERLNMPKETILPNMFFKGPAGVGKTFTGQVYVDALSKIDKRKCRLVDIAPNISPAGLYRELAAAKDIPSVFMGDEAHKLSSTVIETIKIYSGTDPKQPIISKRSNTGRPITFDCRMHCWIIATNLTNESLSQEAFQRRFKPIDFQKIQPEHGKAYINKFCKEHGFTITPGAALYIFERSKATFGDLNAILADLKGLKYSKDKAMRIKDGEVVGVDKVAPLVVNICKRWPDGLEDSEARALSLIAQAGQFGLRNSVTMLRMNLDINEGKANEVIDRLEGMSFICRVGSKCQVFPKGIQYILKVQKMNDKNGVSSTPLPDKEMMESSLAS